MTRKSPIIKQGKVTELITELASLPEREKDPDTSVSLPEIFRTKEYTAEIKGALKRGYSFDDLAEIFTEKLGVAVSARQIRYHFTRGKNRGMKSKSAKKAGENSSAESRVSSADSSRKDPAQNTQRSVAATDFEMSSETKDSPKGTEKGTDFASGSSTVKDFGI
jgi:hypothetical protein